MTGRGETEKAQLGAAEKMKSSELFYVASLGFDNSSYDCFYRPVAQ